MKWPRRAPLVHCRWGQQWATAVYLGVRRVLEGEAAVERTAVASVGRIVEGEAALGLVVVS